jgi:hypothetical protein
MPKDLIDLVSETSEQSEEDTNNKHKYESSPHKKIREQTPEMKFK